MSQSLIPNYYRSSAAKDFVESFTERHDAPSKLYYVFAGNHASSDDPPVIHNNVYDTEIDTYKNMIFGKRARMGDVSLMLRRIDYKSGTVYGMYDDKDPVMASRDFYVMVNEGAYYNVFKCLNNNDASASTVQPSLSSVGTDGIFYSSIDGYTWKYMYSVSVLDYDRFATDKYVPLIVNTAVVSTAVPGSIDSIKIEAGGAGYSNYIETAYFSNSDIGLYTNSQYYGLSGAPGASPLDDFYRGCILQVTSGTGAGQYRQILSYEGTSNTKYVVLETALNIKPDNTSQYSIYPGVYITGDQTETLNAVAWAYVSPAGNTISRIEILSKGSDYKIATANVYAHVSAGVTAIANVRPILPPSGGNGADPANELYCGAAAVSVKFMNSESNTVPSTNRFRQIGMFKDPTFANVDVIFSGSQGGFVLGETAVNFFPRRLQNHVSITAGNTYASTEYAGMFDTINSNTLVYVTDGVSTTEVFTVLGSVNSSVIQFTSQAVNDFSNASMYAIDERSRGEVCVTGANTVTIKNVVGEVMSNGDLIGLSSGSYTSNIEYFTISGVQKNHDTFVAAYKYTGTVLSGEFHPNETVIQVTNSVSNAVLHSVQTLGGTTNFYFTNQNGIFNTSNTIIGSNSGAVATLTNKYIPEVVFGSGKMLYLENVDQITRDNRQTETFKLIFEF